MNFSEFLNAAHDLQRRALAGELPGIYQISVNCYKRNELTPWKFPFICVSASAEKREGEESGAFNHTLVSKDWPDGWIDAEYEKLLAFINKQAEKEG